VLADRLEDDGASAARMVVSPTSTVPGSATPWRRAAVLTRSPATMPWFVAPSVTAASPVRPGPGLELRGEGRHRRPARAPPARALGVVLVGDRRAPHRHDRVADELLDRAAVPLDRSRGASK
jgi:hypothetical protein